MIVALEVIGFTLLALAGALIFTKYLTKSLKKSTDALSEEIKIRNSPDKNVRDLFHANRRVNFYRLLIVILISRLASLSEPLSSANQVIVMVSVAFFVFAEPYIYNWYETNISSKFYKVPKDNTI
jgi:hypothetical protein